MAEPDERDVKTSEVRGYEEAVTRLRAQPDGRQIVAENFLEPDIEAAAERFWQSQEWKDTMRELEPTPNDRVLDFGAGRCIASLAFARLGCQVVALDINPSPAVGLGVLSDHEVFRGHAIYAVLGDAEHPAFPAGSFDIVYCREALHHAFDLQLLVAELTRVLRPGGRFYAYGEHRHPWWSSDEEFRKSHPAVQFGANEHSYTVQTYVKALKDAGLRTVTASLVMSPLFADRAAPMYHRVMRTASRVPLIGAALYRSYVWAQIYRSVGSQVTILGRK